MLAVISPIADNPIIIPRNTKLILSPVFPTEERGIRHIVKFITYICFALSITLCMFYDFWQSENTIEVSFSWINSLGIDVSFVVDTLSAILTAISSFIFIIVCNISRGVKFPQRLYYALILALQTSVTGMILSKDMMLFTTFTAQMSLRWNVLPGR